jgi:hypothetical protein
MPVSDMLGAGPKGNTGVDGAISFFFVSLKGKLVPEGSRAHPHVDLHSYISFLALF